MASPVSTGTTRSRRTNPFEGPDPVVIRDLNILARVPIVLDHLTSTYYAWKTYFSLVFLEYNLRDHIDVSVDSRFMENDEEWTSIDATLIHWFYTTISKDLFHTVVSADDDAHAVWTKLNGLFIDNALQYKVFLHGKFFGCQQLDSSVDDYCMRLKKLVDELRDLGEKVSDELLLSTLIAGLNEDFGNAASNIPLITNPTFPKIVAYLKLEERRMRMSRTQATHMALTTGAAAARVPLPDAAAGPPPPPTEQQQRRGGRRSRSGRKQQQHQPAAHGGAPRQPQQQLPPAPWQAGQNPWTGVVHAYSMPIPRAPVPGFFGARLASHQALYAAPQSYPLAPLYGPSAAYGLPSAGGFAAPLPQPLPSAPALLPAPWDPALLAALHTAPTPQQYTGGGDWYMDIGATAHMAANPGNLLTAQPVHTAARIIVGDGSSMPITHVGHAAFPSNSMPLYLSNILVSPDIIKNLVSVRSLTRENPVTVEFDMFGFSVKDARTRMVLHRCDSPDELYPVHSSTSSVAAPMALSAGVDLWGCTPPGARDAHCALGLPDGRAAVGLPGCRAGLLGAPRALACRLFRGGLARDHTRGGLARGIGGGGLFFVFARCQPGLAAPPNDSLSGWHLPPEYALEPPFGILIGSLRCRKSSTRSNGTAPGSLSLGRLVPASSRASGFFGTRLVWMALSSATKLALGRGFTETFAPVVKPGTIRTVLQLAVSRAWPVHQLDVCNAFLHGHLIEQVFCEQPTDFVDTTHPDHVCLLSRSFYGLKQAPRAWYQRIAAFLQTLGFTLTRSDDSLFVYHHGVDTAYLLLYVDDIILTASTVALLQRLTAHLRDEFALKDLGPLHYFLGIEVVRWPDGFFLHQQRYAHELLDRAGMLNCKPAPTPVDTKAKVSALEGSPASDAAFYRSIVGALQYLTLTRPNLQYAV
ncbi:uncharacterized protein [Aegilops tauschii subsp. strangulata]|uniref:uncharacterized protein n=1 Tax=Aegilops tauschii subsp. strangulata TaxID=200361 RepID=UPI003CC87AC8